MTTPDATSDLEPKELLARLRKEAFLVIQNTGGASRLQEILKRAGDPRLLDIPSASDDYPDTLLEWSIREFNLDCARILIDSGADPMQGQLGGGFLSVHVLACNAGGMTRETIEGFVELLSAAGADFDAKDDKGWTPLHYTVHHGFPWTTEVLIQRGVQIDPALLDPATEAEILPNDGEDLPYAVEALRVVRSLVMEQKLLSAMPNEGEPVAKPSLGMTL